VTGRIGDWGGLAMCDATQFLRPKKLEHPLQANEQIFKFDQKT